MSHSVHDTLNRPRLPRREIQDSLHLRLFAVDTLTIPAHHWNSRNVQSPFWRLYRNEVDGAYINLEGGERFPFVAEQVYFVPSGVRFSCGNEATFRHFYIHFDLLGLSRLTMRSLFGGPVTLPFDMSFSARVANFARDIARNETLDMVARCRAKSLIYEGIARYLDSLTGATRERVQRETATQEFLSPALTCIEENLATALTIPQLGALCCQSPDHFARRFKMILGQTPNDYIREQRVMRAAQQLLFSNDSLEAIAESCGFGTRHYLTRVFTEMMGMPPARYRKGAGRHQGKRI